MKIIYIIILLITLGGVAMANDKNLTYTVKETPHTIRFHGMIFIGGDVKLMYSDMIFQGEDFAFRKWFENLTVKELREKWGYDVLRHFEVNDELQKD